VKEPGAIQGLSRSNTNNSSGSKYRYAAHLSFTNDSDKFTNNIAEYEAIILGLRKLRAIGVRTCIINTNSKIVVGQIKNDCVGREPVLLQYMPGMRSLQRKLQGFTVQRIDRLKK
jgi:ribonuclease HI